MGESQTHDGAEPCDDFREAAERTGECMDCGEIQTATVTVHKASGVAGWTCPECGKAQEPPRAVEVER